MLKSSLFTIALCALLLANLSSQQPNSSQASFSVDDFDNGSYPLAPLLSSPGSFTFQFAGSGNQPFLLFAGPVLPGAQNAGLIGLLDLDPTAPSFSTLLNGFAPQTPYDSLAVLNALGERTFPVNFPQGFSGSFGGLQALMADPASAAGFRLSAANIMDVLPRFTLNLVTPNQGPAAGGQIVNIVGHGFVPGLPVTVKFGSFAAPFATVWSTTTIIANTPANFPGTTVDVTVIQRGLQETLPAAYSVDPLPYAPVLINEVFTGSPDYVELYNPNPVPVDISGWSLHSWYHGTTPDSGSPHVFTYGTVLLPFSFLVVEELGITNQPGTLPSSVSIGYNFWWTGTREVEVALLDNQGLGVDYVHRKWQGTAQAPNLPFPTAWTGAITSPANAIFRISTIDTDSATDFGLGSAGTPGLPNPGQ